MNDSGIILYGPPASGKDTVTRELQRIDARCRLFPRLKVGEGRSENYRIIRRHELEKLQSRSEIAWVNHRYAATYAVDTPALVAHFQEYVSIVHLGQLHAIDAVQKATPDAKWCVVELWCPRDEAEVRLIGRGSTDLAARLQAWDETERLSTADVRIDTNNTPPAEAARSILAAMEGHQNRQRT